MSALQTLRDMASPLNSPRGGADDMQPHRFLGLNGQHLLRAKRQALLAMAAPTLAEESMTISELDDFEVRLNSFQVARPRLAT